MDAVIMHDATSRLSALVDAVESGREAKIVIARNGRPAARLVPVAAKPDIGKRIGVAEGRFAIPDDIDEDEEEIVRLFETGDIFPK